MRACSLSLRCSVRDAERTRNEREGRLDDACIRCLIAEPFFGIHSSPPTSHFSAFLPLSFVCMHAKGQTLKHDDRDETDWPFVTRSTASEYLQHRRSRRPPLFSPRFLAYILVRCIHCRCRVRKIRTNCRAGERFPPRLRFGRRIMEIRETGSRKEGDLMRAVLSESSSSCDF